MLALSERRAEVVGELGMGWLFAGEPPPAPPPPASWFAAELGRGRLTCRHYLRARLWNVAALASAHSGPCCETTGLPAVIHLSGR